MNVNEQEEELLYKIRNLVWDLDYGFVPEIQMSGALIELRSLVREWNTTHPQKQLTWDYSA